MSRTPDPDSPRVGAARDDYRATCSYAFAPSYPQCEAAATRHLHVHDAQYGAVALSICDDHAPVARVAAALIAEHPHSGLCGLPGTVWDHTRNECVIDGTGTEPAYTAAQMSVCP